MKFRIIGSVVVIIILIALAVLTDDSHSTPQPRRAPSSSTGSDPFKDLKTQ